MICLLLKFDMLINLTRNASIFCILQYKEKLPDIIAIKSHARLQCVEERENKYKKTFNKAPLETIIHL